MRLSKAQARRIALVAQGFRDPRHAVPTMRTFDRTLARTGVLQIDSVNVLTRAHYMPLFSRMGPYDVDLLRRASEGSPRRPRSIVEYWAHVAAFMPVELWPVMRHRMRHYEADGHDWVGRSQAALVRSLLAEVAERGPSTPRDLDEGLPRVRENWGWNWSATKRAMEYLFVSGRLAVARRNSAFERVFDLPERVIPQQVLEMPEPTPADASVELVRRSARAHGVGTEFDLRDYFRMRGELFKPALAALVDSGELVPVEVEGWRRPAYLHRDAALPRKVDARALLSPFDPLVWERARTEQLFDFHYRIEIYVPEPKRVHGYYVLPFLLGEDIVARVDLKADRTAGVLLVKGAFAEPWAPEETAEELAAELADLSGWLGLEGIVVEPRGDLAAALGLCVRSAESVPRAGSE
ncbi:MAG TPA: crosslink repair DNA glycosylase YcaQ family protein [Nocardioidaceae bacterium]|nr:crosslink repair DNA glycosylase YcaQ family protein [Nocardioidaceae bacterium]